MACTLANGVRTPWNRERLYEKKISIRSNLDALNGLSVSENDLFKNSVNTLCRFLTLFIACSDTVCFIYKPAYALPMLYKTVQSLSVVHVSATVSPSPDYVKHMKVWYTYSSNVHLYHGAVRICSTSHTDNYITKYWDRSIMDQGQF